MTPRIAKRAAAMRAAFGFQKFAITSAMAGITGRMYCGRLDCEIEKKTNGTRIQSARKSVVSSRRSLRHAKKATIDHGSAPPTMYGMKYHGGPVRLSAFVARRCAVSVTRT